MALPPGKWDRRGLAAALFALWACKSTRSRDEAAPSPPAPAANPADLPPLPGDDLPPGSAPSQVEPLDPMEEQCDDRVVIDLSTVPVARENLEVAIRFYGDSTSTLIAIALPKYQHGGLSRVVLANLAGDVLAQRGIFEASDIDGATTTLKPLVFENIALRGQKRLVVLFRSLCAGCEGGYGWSKFVMPAPIQYEQRFRGKPVYHMTPSTVPGNFESYQARPIIKPSLHSDLFPRVGGSIVAQRDAEFDVGGLNGFVITDVMGRVIAEDGSVFRNVVDYPEFIAYKLVNSLFYVRTFVRAF